ncbi:MAG: lipid-A-disaccharide synthase [Paracoccaceae bacterium]
MRVFVIAGEASGDALGGALMQNLQTLRKDIEFDGVGGPLMQAQGLVSRFDMQELSVMGIAEVLPKYRHLKRRIAEMAEAVLETKPDVLITIDSPDFCLRVAKLVKAKSSIRTVHYVAPSVWAWRPKRAVKMAKCIDHVLALLPFEPPYMEATGMACDFVGHPVVTEPVATDQEVESFRKANSMPETGPIILVLPGSRRGEVQRLAPIFGQAIDKYLQTETPPTVVLVRAPSVAELVDEVTQDWSVQPIMISGDDLSEKRAAFKAADVALAASGTVALELAAAATPMVIGYNMNWLSFKLIRRAALIDRVNLVNIVTDTYHVPECLGPDCTPDRLAQELRNVLKDPEPQIKTMSETMQALGAGGEAPGLRAANAVLARM